jgi:hypothetical protein
VTVATVEPKETAAHVVCRSGIRHPTDPQRDGPRAAHAGAAVA